MQSGIVTEPLGIRFSRLYGGSAEEAERRLLLKSIPIWKRPLWHGAEKWAPHAVEPDRDAIREATRATSVKEIALIVEALHYRGRTNPNFWRSQLGLRISGRKLQNIAKACFQSKSTT
ncbi:MAG TPA: hypothetical protein VMF06_19750 [Candidatus Limnocylindria bacterium]|jgi:hypothetical protein|nr:hypothetical protein [Candidatus Limnocylindria bacterium]